MTRKDFEFIASLVKAWRDDAQFARCTRGNVFWKAVGGT